MKKYQVTIPKELHDRLRTIAALADKTMREVAINGIEKEIRVERRRVGG